MQGRHSKLELGNQVRSDCWKVTINDTDLKYGGVYSARLCIQKGEKHRRQTTTSLRRKHVGQAEMLRGKWQGVRQFQVPLSLLQVSERSAQSLTQVSGTGSPTTIRYSDSFKDVHSAPRSCLKANRERSGKNARQNQIFLLNCYLNICSDSCLLSR